MQKYSLGLLMSICLLMQANAQLPKMPSKKIHVYLLAGQSNMAGRGTVEAEDTIVYPNIWMLNKAEEWVPAREPLAFDKSKAVGVGPGFAFAKAMAKAEPDALICLVPSAVGGSRIDLWNPGVYDSVTKCYPYDDAVRRTRKAMEFGTLKGIIWHQGESDCTPALSAVYEPKLTKLILRFRKELKNKKLPFVAGEIAHFRTEPNPSKEVVNQAIKTVVQTLPACGYVATGGMHHRGDSLHFDSPSARLIGQRYASEMLRLIK